MSYLESYKNAKGMLDISDRLTIKLATDIKADVVSGFCHIGTHSQLNIESFFEVQLESPSYMKLIEAVVEYYDSVTEVRKFSSEFQLFIENDWILEIVTPCGFRVEFTKNDVIHLLETPIFATYKDSVFFNYNTTRNFSEDFSSYFACDMDFFLPISIVSQEMKNLGWHLASN